MKRKTAAQPSKVSVARAQRQTAAATVNAMFALKGAEEKLRALSVGETIGETGERLAVQITALTLAIEELNRAADNLQRAIESY